MLTNYLQFSNIILTQAHLIYPQIGEGLNGLIYTFSTLSNPSVPHSSSIDCLLLALNVPAKQITYVKLLFWQSCAIIKIIIILIFFQVRNCKKKVKELRKYIILSLICIILYEQPGILYNLFMFSGCVDDYLYLNPNINCEDPTYLFFRTYVAYTGMAFWGLLVPIALLLFLCSSKQKLDDPYIRRTYGSIINSYRKEVYYWGLIKMILRLLLLCGIAFILNLGNGIANSMIIILLYYFIFTILQPYEDEQLIKIEKSQCFSYLASLLLLNYSYATPLEPIQKVQLVIAIIINLYIFGLTLIRITGNYFKSLCIKKRKNLQELDSSVSINFNLDSFIVKENDAEAPKFDYEEIKVYVITQLSVQQHYKYSNLMVMHCKERKHLFMILYYLILNVLEVEMLHRSQTKANLELYLDQHKNEQNNLYQSLMIFNSFVTFSSLILSLFISIQTVSQSIVGDISLPDSFVRITKNLTLYFNIEPPNIILAPVFGIPNYFFGIGLGPGMIGADIWEIELPEGESALLTDNYAIAHTYPIPDPIQNLEILGSVTNSSLTLVKFRRALDTGDPHDRVIVPGLNPMIWAWAESRFIAYHGPNRGIFLANLVNGFQGDAIPLAPPQLFTGHAILMTVAWLGLYDVAILMIRFLKRKPNGFNYLYLHYLTAISSFVVSTVSIGIVLGIERANGYPYIISGLDLRSAHFITGMVILGVSIGSLVLGIFIWIMLRIGISQSWLYYARKSHLVIGYLLYLITKANAIMGSLLYGTIYAPTHPWFSPIVAYISTITGGHIFLTFYWYIWKPHIQRSRSAQVLPENRRPLNQQQTELMSLIGEGQSRSQIKAYLPNFRWVILENTVCDLNGFNHPGGNFIIEEAQGREISRFIYGSYGLESKPQMMPHLHSFEAITLANSLSIGRIYNIESILLDKSSNQEAYSTHINKWVLKDKARITNTLGKFEFLSEELLLKPFIRTIQGCGRHFIIYKDSNPSLKRLYTVACSLSTEMVEFRAALVEAFFSKKCLKIKKEWMSPRVTMPFFIKRYPVKGFSEQLHDAIPNESTIYRLMGPNGRGIELGIPIGGRYYIFCAGTGILPFLDFLNFLLFSCIYNETKKSKDEIQKSLEKLDVLYEVVDIFEIILFGSFSDSTEAYGLEIIQKLASLNGILKKNFFTCFIPGLANEYIKNLKCKHFDEKALRPIVKPDSKLFYVCGPPKFNNAVPEVLIKLGVPKDKIFLF